MALTVKRLSDAEWKQVYAYDYAGGHGAGFKVYSCDAIPDITITHDRKVGSKQTIIYYTVRGLTSRRTDSPTQAVKWFNDKEKRESGRRTAPGSPQSAKRA